MPSDTTGSINNRPTLITTNKEMSEIIVTADARIPKVITSTPYVTANNVS
jgi:hypothetical protein